MITAASTSTAQHPRQQRGAALIVSMMMLVAITLIGVAVMSNSRLEWLMSTNSALQTSTYPQTEAALLTAEAQIRANICTALGPPPAGCNPQNFNWAANDAFYSQPTLAPPANAGVAVAANPLPADPRNINNWGVGFNTNTVVIGGVNHRYVVLYRGCAFVPNGQPPMPNCGDPLSTSVYTFEIWVLSQSPGAKGVARLIQSTYALYVNLNPNNGIIATGTDVDAIIPTSPSNNIQFRRVGQVDI